MHIVDEDFLHADIHVPHENDDHEDKRGGDENRRDIGARRRLVGAPQIQAPPHPKKGEGGTGDRGKALDPEMAGALMGGAQTADAA